VEKDFLDIEDIAREIRRETMRPRWTPPRPQLPEVRLDGPLPRIESSQVEEFLRQVESGELVAGQLPPMPPTLRGRLGRVWLRVINAVLAPRSGQLSAFQRRCTAAVGEQARALDALWRTQRQQHAAIQALIENMRALEQENRALRGIVENL
jgi:hypothetical protein